MNDDHVIFPCFPFLFVYLSFTSLQLPKSPLQIFVLYYWNLYPHAIMTVSCISLLVFAFLCPSFLSHFFVLAILFSPWSGYPS